jgi:hypothetical protein
MTAIPTPGRVDDISLISRIAAELRPEFVGEVIFVDLSDPIVRGTVCTAGECDRIGVLAGMCKAHNCVGSPPVGPNPNRGNRRRCRTSGGSPNPPACAVVGCRRACDDRDLCHTHLLCWWRQGAPISKPGSPIPAVLPCGEEELADSAVAGSTKRAYVGPGP